MKSGNGGSDQGGAFSTKKLIVIGVLVVLAGLIWRGRGGDGGGAQSNTNPAAGRSQSTPRQNQGNSQMQADPYPGFYAAYEMPAELVEGEIALTAWGGAAELYRSGDYEGAATAFTEVLVAGGEMPVELVQFFLGQSHLAAGTVEPAVVAFQAVVEGENDNLAIEARWFLALACIRTGDAATAREQLEHLVSEKAYNADPAKMLLAQMGS
ncbi:MAG: tetratricopeptide repeat protein [Planctomycetota bacterium]|nr:tetratricopeptide repeat protein [Planctomycetota bacterium]